MGCRWARVYFPYVSIQYKYQMYVLEGLMLNVLVKHHMFLDFQPKRFSQSIQTTCFHCLFRNMRNIHSILYSFCFVKYNCCYWISVNWIIATSEFINYEESLYFRYLFQIYQLLEIKCRLNNISNSPSFQLNWQRISPRALLCRGISEKVVQPV